MPSRPRYLLNRDGRYFARLVVPADLRPFLLGNEKGKTELRVPLGPDYRTATKRLHTAVAQIQHKIAQAERRKHAAEETALPMSPRYELTDEEIARQIYDSRIATDERLRDYGPSYALGGVSDDWQKQLREGVAGTLDDLALHSLVGLTLDRFRETGNTGTKFATPEWRKLARLACQAMLEASERTVERNTGNFAGHPSEIFTAPIEAPPHVPVRLRTIFNDYVAARAKVGRGREAAKSWARVIDDLIAFMGHDDVTLYTKANLREWRDKKLETLSARTVATKYLASIRTVLNWARENDHIVENPAQDVRQALPKKMSSREKGYTDDEAAKVLQAARSYEAVAKDGYPIREAATTTEAKRWLPWLAAFSGARIAELAQLRREDFRQEHGAWIMRITPDAGTTKTGQYRDVPIHPQLLDLGFEDLIARSSGPLFYRPQPGRDAVAASRTVADRVAKFLRARKLVPEGVSPHHGFRHRFKSVGLEAGVSERVLDAICGHASRTAGESYGDVTMKTRIAAIRMLPRCEVHTLSGQVAQIE